MILPFALFSIVSGWSGDGHRIITQIALGRLSERGTNFVESLIGSKSIVTASLWADTEAAERAYPGSSSYHFCNTPYRVCGAFQMDRDCGNNKDSVCIVTALADAIETLVDIGENQVKRTDALKFILHLMGDIHQPLHIGFRHDYGGNSIRLDYPHEHNLHTIWDTWLVERLAIFFRASSWRQVADHLLKRSVPEAAISISFDREGLITYASNLATNTATQTTCNEGYTDHTGGAFVRGKGNALNEKLYSARKLPIVEKQLTRAGSLLAQLIEAIVEEVGTRRAAAKAERREAASLFSRLVEEASKSKLEVERYSGSGFSLLSIDFGPELEEPACAVAETISVAASGGGCQTSDKKTASKNQRKPHKAAAEDFDALVSEYREVDSASRNYELFNGIDLSRIRSVRRNRPDGSHYLLVTDAAFLDREPEYFPPMGGFKFRTYLPSNGTYELEHFDFDLAFFAGNGKDLNDEVRIRALLKLAKKDCTIDISEYLTNIDKPLSAGVEITAFARVPQAGESGMSYNLVPELREARALRIEQRAARAKRSPHRGERWRPFLWAFQTAYSEGRLAVFSYGNVVAIFTTKTLRTAGDWTRMSLAREYREFLDSSHTVFFFIDTDIYEGCRSLDEAHLVIGEARKIAPTTDSADFALRPSLKQELIAMHYLTTTKDDDPEVIRLHPNRSVIAQYVMYEDSDSKQMFLAVEWQTTTNL